MNRPTISSIKDENGAHLQWILIAEDGRILWSERGEKQNPHVFTQDHMTSKEILKHSAMEGLLPHEQEKLLRLALDFQALHVTSGGPVDTIPFASLRIRAKGDDGHNPETRITK